MVPYIYRDYEFTLTNKNCPRFLRDLAISRGTITSNFCLTYNFPATQANRWKMFFRLRWPTATGMEKFHTLGHQTSPPRNLEPPTPQ